MKSIRTICGASVLVSMLAPVASATTFTVNTTADTGSPPLVISLRDAINLANLDNDPVNPTVIDFQVPDALLTPPGPGGVAVIQPLTPLPVIQNVNGRGIRIIGFSQPGSSFVPGNTSSLVVKVELDGSRIPTPYVPPPPPASQFAHGLYIMSSNNWVRGLCVHSFPHDGISIQGIWPGTAGHPGSNTNQIYWNLVGTDVTGMVAMPNGHDAGSLWGGIYVKVLPGSPGIANQNHILENVVSGNTIEGVGISNCPDLGSDVQQNHVERCYVGIDITGTGPLGNGHDGIYVGEGAHHNVLDQNWVGNNGYSGVGIVGYGPSNLSTHTNTVIHNRIGVDVNLNFMGNMRHGVAIGSYGGTVWGFAPGNVIDSNTIAHNALTGVAVEEDLSVAGDQDTSFNTITRNAIYFNGFADPGYLGIDLGFEPGVTPNDLGDPDSGGNDLINFPVITSAIHNAGTTTVNGTLDIAGAPANVEVFRAVPGFDGSNHGQGASYLGNTTTPGATNWTVSLPGSGLPGQWLTATLTDTAGNTSEFSLNVPVWDEDQSPEDLGDAPDSYMTLKASGGPVHVITPGMYLGGSVDGEPDGQPDVAAAGDDNDGNDDEDGVAFPVPLVPGQPAQIDITASVLGRLDAWIDFDSSGSFHPGFEQILNAASHGGFGATTSYTFTVPASAVPGSTFVRVRYSSGGGLLPNGPGAGGNNPDGEVEDHLVRIENENPEELDWGDAPDKPYPTLAASDGARHAIVKGVHLGGGVDAEAGGQPQPHALGDDSMIPPATDDEDGVIFLSPVVVGGTVSLSVAASVPGNLDAWVDFNGNGNWSDPGDRIFTNQALVAGPNGLNFPVPATAMTGTTYARFRFTTAAGASLAPTGMAPDGEVEDYILEIEDGQTPHKMHWAQLPDPEGWDVRGYHPKILADDFRCTASGPITTITFWGSWRGDQVGQIENVHLSIHQDDRSGEFSKPGELLWELDTAMAGIPVQFDDPELGPQGWFDPNTGEWNRPDHQMYFKYTVAIPEQMAFVQEQGTIYWLDIQVECFEGEWGWKTSRSAHFEDDAVWADSPQMPPGWNELVDPETLLSLDLAFVIDGPEQPANLDFGDAPVNPGAFGYPTLLVNNGARHVIATDPTGIVYQLGSAIDAEPDGQPTMAADGDDTNILYPGVPDDEDGVVFLNTLVTGQLAIVQVTASTGGYLDAWIDYNGNGTWDHPAELVISQAVAAGVNNLSFTVPGGAVSGTTYARFRFNGGGFTLLPTGLAASGEVEDYRVPIESQAVLRDWGDAPDGPYPTLAASSGANHVTVAGMFLGNAIDPEPNGQPDPTATGDDVLDGNDDEDGVTFYPMVSGAIGTVDIVASVPGLIDAWVDFNGNGSWLDPGDQILASAMANPGSNQYMFPVPPGTPSISTFARVRFSTAGGLAPTGPANDGEVEDYQVAVLEEGVAVFDFGDAPDAPYPTVLAANGARHLLVPGGPLLGLAIDAEPDGQPDPLALGDDNTGGDEDGVGFPYPFIAGQNSVIQVLASAPGVVDGWIDFNANGSWFDPGEQVLVSAPVGPGTNLLPVNVPMGVIGGPTFARFRISTAGGLTPTGAAPDGEVEDYVVVVDEDGMLDFGDAPDPTFPTLLVNLGAAHSIDSLFMGATIDGETDGQPTGNADGDDLAGSADEDGVSFLTPLVGSSTATIQVAVSQPGTLDAWIDFDGDGSWSQPDNAVISGAPVNPGDPPFTIVLPPVSMPRVSYARFRLSHGGTSFNGFTAGGEVEDYIVGLGKRIHSTLTHTITPPTAVLNWLAEPGAVRYSVYSSTTLTPPFPGAWTLETPTPPGVTGLSWSEPITVPMKFYTVVAWPW